RRDRCRHAHAVGCRIAEVNYEAGVFGATHEGDGRADFNAEGFIFLGAGDVGSSGCPRTLAALNVDGAGRRNGATSVGGGANAGGIGSIANVALNFILGLLTNDEAGQQKWKNK